MEEIYLKALDPEGGDLIQQPLSLDSESSVCLLRLRSLAGASAIHVALADEQAVRLQLEIPAKGGESVLLRIQRNTANSLEVSTVPGERKILTLAPSSRSEPASPIRPNASDGTLDLALIIDGTSRYFFRGTETPESEGLRQESGGGVLSEALLRNQQSKAALAEQLGSFVRTLTERFTDCRVATLAFGDQRQPDDVEASDLIPTYRLYPPSDNHVLQALDAAQLQARLLAMPPSSGGDFVDALADALYACRELHWRPEARKIALIYGDSPGHCILHPPPKGANVCVRKRDVDVEAMHLHRGQVELVTVYNDPPSGLGLYDLVFQRELLEYARDQYRRLASLPELVFEASTFEGAKAAESLSSITGPIGRSASYGELIEVLTDSEHPATG